MKYLLIWENIPETTDYYIFEPGIHDEIIKLAREAHGYYIGAENNEAVETLGELLGKYENSKFPQGVVSDVCDKTPIPPGPYAEVFVCGLIM